VTDLGDEDELTVDVGAGSDRLAFGPLTIRIDSVENPAIAIPNRVSTFRIIALAAVGATL